METIKNYLDNMFNNLPKSKEILDIKENMLSNMEDKYIELKENGKSENEAIGIVISEFGNIDELLEQLNIKKEDNSECQIVSQEEVEEYLSVKKKAVFFIGIGAVLCVLAPAIFLLVSQLIADGYLFSTLKSDGGDLVGIIPMFIMIAIAIGLFIYSGMLYSKCEHFQNGVSLEPQLSFRIKEEFKGVSKNHFRAIITGISLLLLSVIVFLIGEDNWGETTEYTSVVFLTIVAIAVFLFIYMGVIKDSYKVLFSGLQTKMKREKKRAKSLAAKVIFLTATGAYIFWCAMTKAFAIALIVYVLAAIIYAIVASIISFRYSRMIV